MGNEKISQSSVAQSPLVIRLREAFEKYARHDDDCTSDLWNGKGPLECSCGLYQLQGVIEELFAAQPKGQFLEPVAPIETDGPIADIAFAENQLSEHIGRFHDFDYQPHEVPPELASLRAIQHHLMGALMAHAGNFPPPNSSADRAEALRLLAAEDARQDTLAELLEMIREQIRLEIQPENRPDGLFKNIQDVYAMRGRTRLTDDAAITHVLNEPQRSGEPAYVADPDKTFDLLSRLRTYLSSMRLQPKLVHEIDMALALPRPNQS